MIEQDTIKLLRECDAGIKMGVEAIDKVFPYIKNSRFKTQLEGYKNEHEKIKKELQGLLDEYHDTGKEPSLMATSMSWLKTNMKLVIETSDETIADLMTDGCNMGVKSIYRYINQYEKANQKAKELAKRLANLEEKMEVELRKYL